MKLNFFSSLILLSAFAVLLSCNSLDREPYLYFGNDKIVVHFERNFTEDQFNQVQTELNKRSYEFKIIEKTMDGSRINKLSIQILKDGKPIGEANSNFVNLRAKKFGFIIEFSPDGDRFMIGDL
ncbi:MAG TPA: hypothetical protein PK006_06170 [Saprospiraceae bacterium]|nr:hypothetical protein [Saprospiraceae bacterium]